MTRQKKDRTPIAPANKRSIGSTAKSGQPSSVFKRPKREKQQEAADAMHGHKFFALCMARRVGKTKVVVDRWLETIAEGQPRDLLVIAPGGVYRTWRRALNDEVADSVHYAAFEWSSTAKDNMHDFAFFLSENTCPRAFFINSEAAGRLPRAMNAIRHFVGRRKTIVAVDESVIIKNKNMLSEFLIDEIGPHADERYIMTGLVSPKSPLDVYRQFRFLSKTIFPESYDQFRSTYAEVFRSTSAPVPVIKNKLSNLIKIKKRVHGVDWVTRALMDSEGPIAQTLLANYVESSTRIEALEGVFKLGGYLQHTPIITGWRNLEELNARIAPHMYQCRLEDCYDMPVDNYSSWDVEMTREQASAYATMRDQGIVILQDIAKTRYVTASDVIVQRARMHQICLGYLMLDNGEMRPLPENRTSETIKIVEGTDGQMVIWCVYKNDIIKVSEALRKIGATVANFYGGNIKTREQESDDFEAGKLDVMVGTPDAGRYGRNWPNANVTIYHGCRDNLDHRLQSEDRVKAVGKTTLNIYFDLQCRGTIEEEHVKSMVEKSDLAQRVEGKQWRQWL